MLLGVLAQTQAACDTAAPRPAASRPSSPSARDNVPAAVVAAAISGVEPETPNGGDAATIPASGTPAAPSAPEPELRPNETQPQRAPKSDGGVSHSSRGGGEEERGGIRGIGGREKGGKAISREAVERAAELRKEAKGKGVKDPEARGGIKPEAVIAINSEDTSKATEATASMRPSSKRRVLLPVPDGAGDEGIRPAKKLKTAPLPRARESGNDGDGGQKVEKKKKKMKIDKKKKTAKKGDEFDDLFKDLF